jgi:hypothetical protein
MLGPIMLGPGVGSMRHRSNLAIVLVSTAMLGTGIGIARGQDSVPSIPPPRPLSLEYADPASAAPAGPSAGVALPGTGPSGPATPSPQARDVHRRPSRAAVAQLANPFDGGSRPGPNGRRIAPGLNGAVAPAASGQGLIPRLMGGWREPTQVASSYPAEMAPPPSAPSQQASPQIGPEAQAPSPPGGMPGVAPGGPAGAIAGGAPAMPGAAAPEGLPGAPALPPSTTGAGAAPGAGAAGAGIPGVTAPTPTAPEAGVPGLTTPGAGEPSSVIGDLTGEGVGAGFGGTLGAAPTPFAMIGDISPLTTHTAASPPGPPRPPGARGASPIFSSVRNFKISENQSPRPQDRVFFDFNYYNNINNAIDSRNLSPVTQMKAYVYNFGVEKTFNQGMGSVGIRLPLDNLTANSYNNIVSTPTSTALGNMTVFAKYILAQNLETGSLISACWAITPQTATSRFAGAPYLFPLNSTYFQTCIGYIYNHNNWYFQGFSGFTFSMNPNDVSIVYNDLAVGYYLIRNPDPEAWLSALAPTFEAHANDPIDHRDWQNRFDLAGTPDSVDLTIGLNFGIRHTAVLTAAFCTPVTTPRPFDSEAVLMLNIYYGRTRRAGLAAQMPPPL